jgi:hypothetical protein
VLAPDESVLLYGVAADGHVYGCLFRGGAWHGWDRIGQDGGFADGAAPSATGTRDGNVFIEAVGRDGRIYYTRWDNLNWSAWATLGEGFVSGAPLTVIAVD